MARNFPYQQVPVLPTAARVLRASGVRDVLIYRPTQLDAHAAQVTRAGRQSVLAVACALAVAVALDAGLWLLVWRLFWR